METAGDYTMELDNNVTSFLVNDTGGQMPNLTNLTSDAYCNPWLGELGAWYGGVHGYSSLVVCLFGCVMNLLNLVVLTRREMHNPTNAILTGLAFADLLNDLEYMPFALFMKVLARPGYPPKTYPWALFVLAHSNFSQVCHTISIWLTVTLAVWRYMMVAMPMQNKTLCTMERAKLAIIIAYVCSLLVCIPVYLTFEVKWVNGTEGGVKYYVHYSELAKAHDQLLVNANFWVYSVVIKLIPCLVLTVVSFRLINSLMEAKRRKAQLKGGGRGAAKGGEDGGGDRTTRMLLAVLLLFLMTEFPQGILGLLSLLLGDAFFRSCYLPLGDLMDIVALSNSAINFILYTAMSLKFRQVFMATFHLNKLCPQPNTQTTAVAVVTPTRSAHTTVVTTTNGNIQHSAAV
ncbi:sex peptide receptor [Folsomia candida]|uniref:Sex peptide receptor n=1 Tax=Folsomia candida TaxID=158441 RepID=A0A226EWY0_FOLCA|nr:sex peptide receptor [Folsomia candida]OXA62113.1 Sex peptide receptor [Folsomia candida]